MVVTFWNFCRVAED